MRFRIIQKSFRGGDTYYVQEKYWYGWRPTRVLMTGQILPYDTLDEALAGLRVHKDAHRTSDKDKVIDVCDMILPSWQELAEMRAKRKGTYPKNDSLDDVPEHKDGIMTALGFWVDGEWSWMPDVLTENQHLRHYCEFADEYAKYYHEKKKI